jgi:protein-S-isoprenylcysteine O-methyltransferase Ste14
MSGLPTLGSRGEGWVVIQVLFYGGLGVVRLALPGGWGGPVTTVVAISGAGLIAAGGLLATSGVLALRRHEALTAVPRPLETARLIEVGVYRLVRHPVYGGLILAAIGWAFVRGSIPALGGALVLAGFFDLKRRREEAWLAARYPGYAAYRTRTRRLILALVARRRAAASQPCRAAGLVAAMDSQRAISLSSRSTRNGSVTARRRRGLSPADRRPARARGRPQRRDRIVTEAVRHRRQVADPASAA